MVLLVENKQSIRILTLNRPERRNALSPELVVALTRALVDAEKDAEIKAIVITGAGDPASGKSAFCAGGDLGGGMAGDGFFEQYKERGSFADLLLTFRRMGKPTIAAVNGMALGGGFGIVLACDLAVVAADADLGTPEVKRGLFPMMISALIYEQLQTKVANELVLLGGKVAGQRAVEMGIANKSVPAADVMKEALAYAGQLASLSSSVLQLGKAAIANQRDMPFEQKLTYLCSQLTLNMQLEDAAEGVTAFLQKRDPVWKGR
jgi:enoyl-CoA hydratase/carnithine racemase